MSSDHQLSPSYRRPRLALWLHPDAMSWLPPLLPAHRPGKSSEIGTCQWKTTIYRWFSQKISMFNWYNNSVTPKSSFSWAESDLNRHQPVKRNFGLRLMFSKRVLPGLHAENPKNAMRIYDGRVGPSNHCVLSTRNLLVHPGFIPAGDSQRRLDSLTFSLRSSFIVTRTNA